MSVDDCDKRCPDDRAGVALERGRETGRGLTLDELVKVLLSDSSLLSEGHGLGEELNDTEDERVSDQLERRSLLDVGSEVVHLSAERGNEQMGRVLLGTQVSRDGKDELASLGGSGPGDWMKAKRR